MGDFDILVDGFHNFVSLCLTGTPERLFKFALLGLLMGRMSTLLRGKTYPGILGLGLGCACIDETIQYYVPGRASMLTDVWIDFSGFATGLILLTIGYTIYKRKHNPEEIKL